jgi:lysophospholipase L1-like esterase
VPNSPRPIFAFAPNRTFYICYTGDTQPYFDELGCVRNDINGYGLREREEVCGPNPDGQIRVLCIGDSFTFGWGVPVENSWPRLIEKRLREADERIRTVNCGASGTLYVDEYRFGLENRFYVHEPDAVVVTLCLNDLLPTSNALAHQEMNLPFLLEHSRFLRDLFQGYALAASMRIDPERDLVRELLDLTPEVAALVAPWAAAPAAPGQAGMWAGGGVQRDLLAMRDWCRERELPFGVVIWPYFQGLGADEHYPFATIHELVGAYCADQDISFLDLLPVFDGHDTPELWVSPADYHGNVQAHALAEPKLTEFVAELLGLPR